VLATITIALLEKMVAEQLTELLVEQGELMYQDGDPLRLDSCFVSSISVAIIDYSVTTMAITVLKLPHLPRLEYSESWDHLNAL